MPNRILREGILSSPKFSRLGWAEEVFYRRLMSVVDDFGRFSADSGMLRAACYPRQLSKVSDSDIVKWLQVIADAALVRVYPALDGERYLELIKFGQQIRAKKSKFPDPPSESDADDSHPLGDCYADDHPDVAEGGDEDVSDSSRKPTASSSAAPTRTPTIPCPYDVIVEHYHTALPSLPRVKLMSPARQRVLRKAWAWVLSSTKPNGARRASDAAEALQWFADYFARAAENDFLMGRTPRSAEHANWRPDLDYLLTDKGMKQVIEKTQAAAA